MGIEPAVGRLLLRCLWAAISAALVTGCMTSRVEESKKCRCQVLRANHARLETVYGTVG